MSIANGIMSFFKSLLKFAGAAAPVAADVAKATGHEDVVGDIELAGRAAAGMEKAISEGDGIENETNTEALPCLHKKTGG